ncbi:WSC domain-containing protein [Rhizophagus clarus]|nr:WSC domain-containing protein [Rhizophagus clarus]
MANETGSCEEVCVNGVYPRLDPQVSPIGCFVFNNEFVGLDSLNGLQSLNNPTKRPGLTFSDPFTDQIFMDNGYCIKHCIDFLFKYAAIEDGINCRCGNEYALQTYTQVDVKLSDKICNTPCIYTTTGGSVSYPCGGKNAYTVYYAKTPNYIPNITITLEEKLDIMYQIDENRCIRDNQTCGKRTLNSTCLSVNNTVGECIDFCQKGNFRYAGLEAGFQCFCGNEYDSLGLRTGLEHCSSSCFWNSSEICGGSWALSILDVPPAPSPVPSPTSLPIQSNLGLKVGLGVGIPFLLIIGVLLGLLGRNKRPGTTRIEDIDDAHQ